MQRIVITGPESTGKTTLAVQLAAHFNIHCVPEYARSYLASLGRPYTEEDLLLIAKGQLEWQNDLQFQDKAIQICDTSFLVLKIWSDYKYGRCHPWILNQFQNHQPDLYLLCNIDLPWQYDPLRENSDDRAELMAIYKEELEKSNSNYVEISGLEDVRLERALRVIWALSGRGD